MTVHLPAPLALLRRGAQHLLESTLVPLGLFYIVFTIVGLQGALFAALGWSLAALARRVVLRKDIPAVLWVTTALLCVRTLVGYLTGSVFLYFLQPTVQNFAFAAILLATLPLNRPLLAKLADDFCAFPTVISGHPHVQRFFRQVSFLWALVFITNGVTTLWALASATVGNFLMVSTAGSYSVVAIAAGVSLVWFRRSLRAHGITLRLGGHKQVAAA
ncbi:septation protein IspZ [Kutzneria kofuensis]|uniref:Intracellular septation protein A n=1 Tax=Kutzneria kofuensis TaxID=103725 RepID=A0A7W9KSM7_9PSEU|nr:septation protein IspZ [Kutzneria kofuensis]MBB5897678.1 intracellular septation protein A [Kutzneria kofuensis]